MRRLFRNIRVRPLMNENIRKPANFISPPEAGE